MGVFSGWGMKITRADGTGRMPWSPTVVNIHRQKARRGKRALIIFIVVALVACFICSTVWTVTQIGKPKPKPQAVAPTVAAPTFTPVATRIVLPSPTPRWTPMPGYGDWIKFRMEPIK